MSTEDATIGYPPHAVASFRTWVTANRVTLTDWTATCGATGQAVGTRPFGKAGSARRRELCRACWPASWATYHPKPVDLSETQA